MEKGHFWLTCRPWANYDSFLWEILSFFHPTNLLESAKSTRAWESEDTITEDLEEGVIDDNDYDKSKNII